MVTMKLFPLVSGYGDWTAEVKVGSEIIPDGWHGARSKLIPSEWDAADFRLPSYSYDGIAYGVKIGITGRKIRYNLPGRTGMFVRVEIEWVNDGEPNTFSHG